MTDFASMPSEELARSTLERAKDLDAINERAFEAVGPAFLSSIPLCLTGSVALVYLLSDGLDDYLGIGPFGIIAANAIAIAIWLPFFLRWNRAIRDVKAFTAEMSARREELEKRNRSASRR